MIYGKRGSPNHIFYRYCLRYHVSKIFDFRNYDLQPIGPVWFVFCARNSNILTAYYGVKQNQFIKPTSKLLR